MFRRQNKMLSEAILALDQRLKQAKGNVPTAFSLLTPIESEFVQEEIKSCMDSRVYYLQNYHVIQPERGDLQIMFPLHDLQWVIEEAVAKERAATGQSKIIVEKPRQSGGSEYSMGAMCHCTFFTPRTYTMTVAQDPETSAHMQRKINIAWENLPWWMRPEKQYHSKGEFLEFNRKDEYERLGDPGLGSVFVTTHSKRETGVAIGRTIRNLHLTEVSRWASGEIYTGDIEPSMNAPDTNAIAESTPLGADGFFYNMCMEAMEGESDWKFVFLPVYRARKYSLPLKPSQKPFILTPVEEAQRARALAEENFRITDEFFNWRRVRLKSSIKRTGHPYAHYESYAMTPMEGFQSSGLCAFPRHKLDEQDAQYIRPPKWYGEIAFQGMNLAPKLLLNQNYTLALDDLGREYDKPIDTHLEKRERTNRFQMWERPLGNEVYYISWDVGGANDGDDFNYGCVWRAASGNNPDVQVASWLGYETPRELGRIAYALGFYYNRCEQAVEYAKEGQTVANYLMNDLEYPNLYRPRARDRVGMQLAHYMHWQTTSKTKPLIVINMTESLIENTVIIRDAYLLNEMRKFSRDGQGWSGLGSHDDACMSALIGLFCLRETLPDMRLLAGRDDVKNDVAGRGARPSGGSVIYGLYDEFTRMLGQTRDLDKANKAVEEHPGWQVKPILVGRHNTAYSLIHHGTGLENQMYREGMDSRDILPGVVSLYRGAMASHSPDEGDRFNELAAGNDGGWQD